ncbi:hypothetical protein [Psychromonas ossibalaenae]|uniref:hypothetical protein n=1 Tax=Psychromonas ossibalaenae TaxID=444922 RepID=UPI00037D88CB|nr:hypothetical protein [Psychromonas ossibalaenae]
MKIMQISWADICAYGDWLKPESALKFALGGYTHVEFQGEVSKCELSYADDGTPLVGLGKESN